MSPRWLGFLIFESLIHSDKHALLQTLLRGVVPDSFPSRLSFDSALPGERRFVIMDSTVFRLYGHAVHQVRCAARLLWVCAAMWATFVYLN
jgi:hypothetical protein